MEYSKHTYESESYIITTFSTVPDGERIVMIMQDKESGELLMPIHILSNFLGYNSPDDMLSTDDWLDILSAIKQKNIDKKFPLKNGNLSITNFHYEGPK